MQTHKEEPTYICFMDNHDDCSGPAKEWKPQLTQDNGQRMYACDKHFHEVWAGES